LKPNDHHEKDNKDIDQVDCGWYPADQSSTGNLEPPSWSICLPIYGFEKSQEGTAGGYTYQLASIFWNSGPQHFFLWITLQEGCRHIRDEKRPGFASCNGQEDLP